MRRSGLCVIVTLMVSACGGDSPSAPSPDIPSVIGRYAGNATLAAPELDKRVTCPASTSVTQSGKTVSIAPIVLTGECGRITIPVGQVTIDATGAIDGSASGSFNEPGCGTYDYVGTGGFFDREFRISIAATSSSCNHFNFTGVLSR
jgi:large exoprotein involved in heme utilization and adhesion